MRKRELRNNVKFLQRFAQRPKNAGLYLAAKNAQAIIKNLKSDLIFNAYLLSFKYITMIFNVN